MHAALHLTPSTRPSNPFSTPRRTSFVPTPSAPLQSSAPQSPLHPPPPPPPPHHHHQPKLQPSSTNTALESRNPSLKADPKPSSGVGLSDDDMDKPQIGISSVWYEGNTCNMHLLKLAEAVKQGVLEAGMVGFRFNTIVVGDAISMGTRGMCSSFAVQGLDCR